MSRLHRIRRRALGWFSPFMSAPVYLKISGIGGTVALLFGTIANYQIHTVAARSLYENLQRSSQASADLLSSSLERPLVVEDLTTVRQIIRRMVRKSTEVRYVAVHDGSGAIVAHTFGEAMPEALVAVGGDLPLAGTYVDTFSWRDEVIVEAGAPVLKGRAGRVRVGLTDREVRIALSSMNSSFLWTLVLCMILGQALALILAWLLTRPIHHLVKASRALRGGDFGRRARVYSSDEIGRLAQAFNDMAESLESYDREVRDKEATRRSLMKRLVSSQEDERRRVARELHDELGQSLSSMRMMLGSSRQGGAHASSTLQAVQDRIDELIQDVRRMAFLLRPSILDDYGLDVALKRYVETVAEKAPFDLDYQHLSAPEFQRLPPDVEVALYRITQEAVTNIVRHSKATSASVVLMNAKEEVTLLVEDNGIGFEPGPEGNSSKAGLGLAGMRERATLLAGEIVVESGPEHGTVLRTRIPLTEVEDDDKNTHRG